MSRTTDLRYLTIGVDHPGIRERAAGAESRVVMRLTTPGGTMREAPLDEAALIKLLVQGASALATLRGVRP